jgi:cell division protein FtsN
MERRRTDDRRQVHMFVSDDRRDGPYERRDDEIRRREREREREKIESIRSFKEKEHVPPPATPMITPKRLIYFGLALLVVVVAVMLLQ